MSDSLEARIAYLEGRLSALTQAEPTPLHEVSAVEQLTANLVQAVQNLGPIQPLIEDESINDILINRPDRIFIERNGKLFLTDITFNDDIEVMKIADMIVKAIGRRIDPGRPLVDARLLDGSRVNVIAPPLAVDGTSISIRKFSKQVITLDMMKERGNVSEALGEFLKIIGKCRLNIIVSGGYIYA